MIKIKFGTPGIGENTLYRDTYGDFVLFKIAADGEVRDLRILFYVAVLNRFCHVGPLWIQVQSRWTRRKNLSLAANPPAAEFGNSLFFALKTKQEIEDFLYKFWHRGPLRVFIWRDIPLNEKRRVTQCASAWGQIEESHNSFPTDLWMVGEFDSWDQHFKAMTLKQDGGLITDAVMEGKILLSKPMDEILVNEH